MKEGEFVIDKRIRGENSKKKVYPVFRFLGLTINSFLVLVLGIVFGVALGLLFFYISMYVQAKRTSIILPNYINSDSSVAVRELEALGFNVVVIGGQGKVIKMDPIPNMRVKVKRKVKIFTEHVTVSRMQLPDFKYSWYKSVEKILRELKINTVVKLSEGEGIYGTIVATSPTPGTEVKSFDSVVLFIASEKSAGNIQQKNEEQESYEKAINTTQETAVEVIPPSVELDSSEPKTLRRNDDESGISLPNEQNSQNNQEPAVEGGQF